MMLQERSVQRGLFEADQLCLGFVGEDSLTGFSTRQGGQQSGDEDFAAC